MKNRGCGRSRTLAHVPGYRVDHCSCGLFHICIGPVTVHMEPDAFLTFGDVMEKAIAAATAQEAVGQPTLSLVHGLGGDVAES